MKDFYLKEITTKIGSGSTPKGGKESYKETGITLIRSMNVFDFKFKINGLAFIDKKQAEKLKNVEVEKYDILLNITGASVARCCMVPEELLPARVNQHVSIIRIDSSKADPHYILNYLNSPAYKQYLLSLASAGATREALTKEGLENLKIKLPNLSTQKKIATILTAYDDLIENNYQRIQLLEEMASNIYKEWFVRFRFPNYQNTKFLDKEGKEVPHGTKGAIPEGWEKKPVKEIVDIISGYAFKSDTFEEEGDYGLVTIKNVQSGYFVTKTTDCIKELPKNIKSDIILKDKDILMSLTGNIGRICMVYGDNYLLNQRVAKLKPRTDDLFEYVYLFFRSDFLRMTLENHSNGAAQQNLSPVDMSELKFITPTDELIESFSAITKSFFDEIIILLKKNQVLQETRDLLLPRLISGKLSVEEMEVEEVNVNLAAEPEVKSN